ncbi:uncharacterized protein LOC141812432 [Curcuma longa]|uniref:uncharacterized protein LOC141812432 n=1 Tax=Curcuma longa TaxID=136217 RepID=UPI003D9E70A8
MNVHCINCDYRFTSICCNLIADPMWEEPPPMVILWSMNDLSRLALGRSENEAKEQGKVDISQSRDMEESINSSVSSLPCSSEVSGWTMYLEDFMAAEEKSQVVSCSSIISDAAPASSTVVDVSGESRKLRLKREKEDDSLQDTASSSFNNPSPKVAENDHSLEGGIPKVLFFSYQLIHNMFC